MNATDKAYEGWTNYETLAVNLWINNDEGIYNYWLKVAEYRQHTAPQCQQVIDGIWTTDEAAKFLLADGLKDQHEEGAPELPNVYGDLLGAALSEVNWAEIAEGLLTALAESKV